MSTRIALLTVAVLCALPGPARADGMYIPGPDASALEMNAQRALLWVRESGLEVILQSSYTGAEEDFGWIVPLPTRPTVEESSPRFLDELDQATAPEFYQERCYIPCPDRSGDADADAGIDTDPPDESVTEWESGTVGVLDYSVISGTEGEALTSWLATHGFVVVPGLPEMLETYAEEGAFFFAARVMPDADISGGVTPVRLGLGPVDEPTFPMRITALSPAETIRVVLWVVGEHRYAPRSYPYELVAGRRFSVEQYMEELDRLFATQDYGGFVAQYVGNLSSFMFYETVGTPCEEMQELFATYPMVSRYVAELAPSAMAEDVIFEPVLDLDVSNYFVSPCPTEVRYEDCGEEGPEEPLPGSTSPFGGTGGACGAAGGPETHERITLFLGLAVVAFVVGRALRRG